MTTCSADEARDAHAAKPDVDTDLEDVLLVPPRLVEPLYDELANARLVARRWHRDGRHGSRIRPVGDPPARRAIPLIKGRYDTNNIGSAQPTDSAVDVDGKNDKLPMLRQLLLSGEVEFGQLPRTMPKSVPRPMATDHTVHHEREAETLPMDAPLSGAFTFLELFAGIGGFRVGLEAIGGRCVFASEIVLDTVAVYKKNCMDMPDIAGDIAAVQDSSIPPHDLLVGGFPCQPFSALGLQPGLADDKGNLFKEIVRVLNLRRPRAFLLENVPGLLHCDGGLAFRTIMDALEGAGYAVSWECINARCLTAQSRNRLYIVGRRMDAAGADANFEFPYVPDLRLRAGDILESDVEIEADGLMDHYTLTNEQEERLRGSDQWKLRGGMTGMLAWEDKTCETVVSHYAGSVSSGTSQLVPRLAPHNPRRFTARECARLLGFPNSFLLADRKPNQKPTMWFYSLYKMTGNAVCPPIIAALGGAILAQCPEIAERAGIDDWRALGRSAGVQLALEALAPHRFDAVVCEQHPSWRSKLCRAR